MLKLPSASYAKFSSILHDVDFNCLFARSVLEGLANGEVWADSEVDPTLIHIIHSYGMSLLLIRSENPDRAELRRHINSCRDRPEALWMQVHPIRHAVVVDESLTVELAPPDNPEASSRAQRHTRSNFIFLQQRYEQLASRLEVPRQFRVRPMSADDFARPGISVSPHRFWPDAPGFLAKGGGYCVTADEQVASLAFAAFRLEDQLEIGVETYPAFRGMGLAKYAAAAMIDYCITEGLQPIWACRKQNAASLALALALGFAPSSEGPYYYLPGIRETSGSGHG
ncbi:GNAT family N-acetyltransferase [Tahibacter sp.]|uniref:GNAT family N-acetyltransferase n=1 Tax=Tahibacter sp. TaxID=2056211 RepID=UPI0028C3E0EA|nr:GNAT family N-acetyltransferase [Tahibacter sp.]